MNKQCLKTAAATVVLIAGSLMSACANSGGQTEEGSSSQDFMSGKPKRLPQMAEKELTPPGQKLSAVFAVDKNGNVHVFAPEGSTIEEKVRPFPSRRNPLSADNIVQMNTINTFQTTNPKTCWISHGALRCISW